MASATRIVIRAEDTGLWKGKQDEETAAKVSSLLQADLELLALYGTGAPPSAIQAAFDANRAYQLGRMPARRHVVAELQADWAGHAHKYLGRGAHYSDFLRFFQDEMDRRGWEAVVGEFLCSGGDGAGPARHMVQRLFAGLAHPMIQLGFGLEWEQPAIMAQGLAQAAVHRNALGDFFDRVDEAARGRGGQPPRAISDICEALRAENGKLAGAAEWRDGGQGLYAGVLGRALDDAVALCAEVRVREHDFEERVAEVLHHGAYVAASASWKPPHIPKYDFYLIHALNASVFLLALDRPCFPMAARIRILEHKMRYDVLQYIARGAPRLSPSHIANYEAPGERQVSRPEDLLPRYHGVADDGHAIKVARSLLLAQRLSREWEGRGWLRLRGDNDWLKAHYMLLRSVEGQDPLWVRGAGFDQAWEGIPALS
ncbi:HypA-like protein, putative [Metarhizium acridum CQMa 102]|uniref:HypA-like protein, putative n=1 Tax=Metarhizium acridum (strain CQMa 102) TaxID=655827 RepID=E9DS76_METAQ|nr:HypA-like protein, putative [Metarhizium acridum CQMa 102]EFY93236.1 HypA-like protein, putative [Metarhizium acridum CQMa 102]